MSKINILYWDEANFGDALNSVLIEELSGKKTQIKCRTKNNGADIIEAARHFLYMIRHAEYSTLKMIEWPWQKSLLAIGSIITWGNRKSLIWGSGFMSQRDTFRGGILYAVRGKYTDEKLRHEGFSGCGVYGDPALLIPLWISPSNEKKYKLGIIPHWKEVAYFQNLYGEKYKVIDLRTRDIHKIVEEITACEYVLSTSLHGIIVAHAYHVPALWIKKGYIDTDGFKFYDYFSSVNIEPYDGFQNIEYILKDELNWLTVFTQNKDKIQINNSIEMIQKNLLKSAPFILRDKYRRLIE